MTNHSHSNAFTKTTIAAAALLLCSLSALAQTAVDGNPLEVRAGAMRQSRDKAMASRPFAVTCPSTTITPPVTINGTLTTSSCTDIIGLYEAVYAVNVSAGQTIDIDYSSSAFEVFLYMSTGPGSSADVTNVSTLSSGVSRSTIHYTFTQSGTYYIEAESLLGDVGAFTLKVSINGNTGPVSGNCVVSATTACLLNNRFQVQVRYRGAFDNNAADSNAQLKQVTGFASPTFETAFFYFNSPNNIEMMIKMLDQGNTNSAGQPTIALLFGSATPLRMELTITDTKNGGVKRYTSAFASQAGQTDFTAFVK